jgi:hypothetical protein
MLSEDWGKVKGFEPFPPYPLLFNPPSTLGELLEDAGTDLCIPASAYLNVDTLAETQ